METVLELTKQALMLTLILSGPPIAAAALVGLVVAFLQAATQLQEQTFAYAIKFTVSGSVILRTNSLTCSEPIAGVAALSAVGGTSTLCRQASVLSMAL